MAGISYLDFDLLIEPLKKGYRARILNSPAGQATTDFRLPFSDSELDNFLLLVGRTRGGVRRIESPEREATKTFGGRLFDAVFTDEVRACLRSSLDEASRQGLGLRIRLRLADVPELADLPWEYLYNPALNRFLTLSAETPLVRYLDLPERIQPLAVKPPLRVLVMISSPSDYQPLDVEQEWAKLKNALGDLEQRGLVTLERLEEATLAALQRRLRQGEYHIFHFIGHGGFDQQSQDGVLVMEDEAERGRQVSGNYLGTLLHDHRPLRLAVLNACEGARASRTDPFAGTAQSLVQQRIPAVIAMQFEVTDEAAITFAHEFYSAVADGYPVDAALAEARKAIFNQGNDVEWATPVLYMRAPDGRIFDVEPLSEEEQRQTLKRNKEVIAMSEEEQTSSNVTHITISGPGGGQVAMGDHNTQIGSISGGEVNIGMPAAKQPEVTETDLAELRKLLADLKAQVEMEAPPEKKEAALERVGELEQAVTAKQPDLSTMEYVKGWFAKNLPSLAGAVTSVVVNPIVGKLVQAAGDTLAAEFKRRFGGK